MRSTKIRDPPEKYRAVVTAACSRMFLFWSRRAEMDSRLRITDAHSSAQVFVCFLSWRQNGGARACRFKSVFCAARLQGRQCCPRMGPIVFVYFPLGLNPLRGARLIVRGEMICCWRIFDAQNAHGREVLFQTPRLRFRGVCS